MLFGLNQQRISQNIYSNKATVNLVKYKELKGMLVIVSNHRKFVINILCIPDLLHLDCNVTDFLPLYTVICSSDVNGLNKTNLKTEQS